MAKKTYKAFSAGELSPDMYGRYDVDKYGTGCMIMKNWVIMAQGGAYKRPGTRFVSQAGNEAKAVRIIPFEFSTIQAYVLEFGDKYMRVYRNGSLLLEADKNITAITNASPAEVTAATHGYSTGDEVYLSGIGGMNELNGRQFKVTVINANTFTLDGLDSTAYGAYTTGGAAGKIYEITTPYNAEDLGLLYYAQTADIMTLCHPNYAPRELTRTGHTAWTISSITFAPKVTAPTGVSASNAVGTGTTTYKYKVTAVIEENYEESLPSSVASTTNNLTVSGNKNTVSWSTKAGAIKYNIYKEKSGVYGYAGSSETTSFTDDNILSDVSDTPPRVGNPFGADGSDDCPAVVTFQQQRRVFASTKRKPDTIFMSKAGSYGNMTTSLPSKNDDAITFAIASGQVNSIRHLIPFRTLLAMTTSQEWNIGSEGVLAPTTVDAVPETNYGSSSVRPIMIGNTAIFAARYGKRIRDYSYTFESDGYDGNDLSVLSRHILKDKEVKEWDFAQEPDDVIWAVMSDGTLATLTYLREHRVWGWARHETAGQVESVACIPDEDGRKDVVYFVVKRTIDGVDHRYIEVLEEYIDDPMEDAYFLDCGLSRTGAPTDTVGGLWHLEGESVAIYADGNVLANETVTNGTITLDSDYSTISVGLGVDYELQPMATESDQGEQGSTRGDPKRIKLVYIEVHRTRGLFSAQRKGDPLNEIPPKFLDGDLANPIEPYTGILEVAVDTSWDAEYVAPYIYCNYPVPSKILTLTPVYET